MTAEHLAWRCTVCGYVHRGPQPPDECPLCGASKNDFEPYRDAMPPSGEPEARQWQCADCKYVHAGPQPPGVCPVCGAAVFTTGGEPTGEAAEGTVEAVHAERIVIVGAGIAGVSAVEAVRRAAPDAEIALVSKETELPYYRLNLTRYLAGEVSRENLPIHPAAWYRENEVRLLLGTEVVAINPAERTVQTGCGRTLPFGKLLLAAGAHPFIPPVPGAELEGVTALRTVADADRILDACRQGAKCVCIGGGLLGLETAAALARQGADVTLLEGYGWLLPRQLNQAAAEILADHVASLGIKLLGKARTREILGRRRVHGVLLEDSSVVPAELVVIATGIRPNTVLARRAGLAVNQGVVVDNTLKTSHADVFAAGDAAEHSGQVYGIWGPSRYQGSIAGMNMVGGNVEFGGLPRSHVLKVLGISVFSIGRIDPEDASFKAVDQVIDGRYYRFVFRDSHLVGAIVLGDTKLTATVKRALENKQDFSELLRQLPAAADVIDHLQQRTSAPAAKG